LSVTAQRPSRPTIFNKSVIMHLFPAQHMLSHPRSRGVRIAMILAQRTTVHSPKPANAAVKLPVRVNRTTPAMTMSDVNYAVNCGRCTWLQVYDTLLNAGASHYTRRQFIDGKLNIAQTAERMIARLIRTGQVQRCGVPA
jgi:hypothetical protein